MKQFWYCMIGPVETKDLDYYGGSMDLPYRDAIKSIHKKFFGDHDKCSSGWGISEQKYRIINELVSYPDGELRQVLNTLERIKHDKRT